MPAKVELLKLVYDQFNARDIETVLAAMHVGELVRLRVTTTAKRILSPTLLKNLGRSCRKARNCT